MLIQQGERSDTLAERTEAFLGWMGLWNTVDLEHDIEELYKIRNTIVHEGDYSNLRLKHLLRSDDWVFNLLLNLVRHPDLFRCKESVLEFCERVKAEKVLGLKHKVRPKSFKGLMPVYRPRDFENI